MWRKYRGEGREEGVAAPPTSGPGVAAHEAQQKQLAAACGLLLEEVEEELVAALREDGGDAFAVACVPLAAWERTVAAVALGAGALDHARDVLRGRSS